MSFRFGSAVARSLNSFGVAGLIAEDGKVYFDTLFGTRHIGRVSDLISARLRDSAPDDLRLRTMLLLAAFEGVRNQPGYDGRKDALKEPLVIECGMDGEKIAVGMAFTLKDPELVRPEGLPKRISIRKATNELEALLVQMDQCADRLVIRYHEASRRMEVVALMALSGGGIEQDEADRRELPEWVPIKDPEQTPRPSKYVALADMEYAELLRDETRVPGSKQAQQRQSIISARGAQDEAERRIRGSAAEKDESETRIRGGTRKADGFLARFRRKAEGGGEEEAVLVPGGGGPEDDGSLGVGGGFTGVGGAPPSEEGEHGEDRGIRKRFRRFAKKNALLRSLWKLGSEEEGSEGGEGVADDEPLKAVAETFVIQGSPQSPGEPGDWVLRADGAARGSADGQDPDLILGSNAGAAGEGEEGAANRLETAESDEEIERSLRGIEDAALSRTLARVQAEAGEIKKELTSEKAKKWVEGLTAELIGERARIQELARRMNTAIRQKDHEFKIKESAMYEEIKRKNEQLMQKGSALNRSKEQVAQLSQSIERLKALEEEKADEAHASQKHAMTQRMLAHTKEENKQLVKKLDQLRAQVDRLQLQKGNQSGPSMTEFSALQTKYERVYRQAEEFKRVNQQLLAQVNAEKTKTAAPKNTGNDELKRRLEAAVKMAAVARRENERVSNRLSEVLREEERLKEELARAQDLLKMQRQLRRARAGNRGDGSGPGGGTPPAESA